MKDGILPNEILRLTIWRVNFLIDISSRVPKKVKNDECQQSQQPHLEVNEMKGCCKALTARICNKSVYSQNQVEGRCGQVSQQQDYSEGR